MIVKVTKKHIRLGKRQQGLCPLSLACYDAFGLDKRCVRISPDWIIFSSYAGADIFLIPLPEKASIFHKAYLDHYSLGLRMPHSFKFSVGHTVYCNGLEEDIVELIIREIENYDGRIDET